MVIFSYVVLSLNLCLVFGGFFFYLYFLFKPLLWFSVHFRIFCIFLGIFSYGSVVCLMSDYHFSKLCGFYFVPLVIYCVVVVFVLCHQFRSSCDLFFPCFVCLSLWSSLFYFFYVISL